MHRASRYVILAVLCACAIVTFLPKPLQAELSDNAYKFDEGLYDKIVAMLRDSAVTGSGDAPASYYSGILITDDLVYK